MYSIKVKGRDIPRLVGVDDADDLLKTIAPRAILQKGEAFTFKCACQIESRHYRRGDILPRWVEERGAFHKENFHKAMASYKAICKRLKEELPPGVGCETTYETFSDDRAKASSARSRSAWVEEGYIFTFTVSKKCSKALYDKHMTIAMPFRDHLLKNRRSVIEAMLKETGVLREDGNGLEIFEITKTQIKSTSPCAYDYDTYYYGVFSKHGMTKLETIGECYGFVLAVHQILKEKRTGFAEAKVNLSAEPDGFAVKLEFPPPKKPELTKW